MITVNDLGLEPRLFPLSFALNPGEKVHIIGPNGSGKSTLLNGLAGLLPVSGSIILDGQPLLKSGIEQQARLRAFLTQSDRPGFHIQVHQYLQLSRLDTENEDEFHRVVTYLTERLSLADKLGHSILHLSGGEWQRVRLAGICLQIWPTLNPQAKLLLLDEPAAALDVGQERLLYQLVDEVAEFGVSVVMANHDLNRTLHHADKVLLLKQGKVSAFGRVEEVINETLISEVFDTKVQLVKLGWRTHLIFD
jgi:vitamin B12 transport system ATP-binding protein